MESLRDGPIDTESKLVFWICQVKKCLTLAYCVHYAPITKPTNLHSIDRLLFPWLTESKASHEMS